MATVEPGTGRIIPDLSQQDFMDRFPAPILDMIFEHQVRDTAAGREIRKALMRFQVVKDVDVLDPRTIGPTEQMVDLAIALEYWPAEDRASVLAQILAAP
jgi:hypothetical protein